ASASTGTRPSGGPGGRTGRGSFARQTRGSGSGGSPDGDITDPTGSAQGRPKAPATSPLVFAAGASPGDAIPPRSPAAPRPPNRDSQDGQRDKPRRRGHGHQNQHLSKTDEGPDRLLEHTADLPAETERHGGHVVTPAGHGD